MKTWMSRLLTLALIAAILAAAPFAVGVPALAQERGRAAGGGHAEHGGGGRGGYEGRQGGGYGGGRGYDRPVAGGPAPAYRAPSYGVPAYGYGGRAPNYGQPAYRQSPPAYRAPGYGAPAYGATPAYGGWRRGQFLPPAYRGAAIADYGRYHLRRPPRGYYWCESGDDFVLVAITTGLIFEVIPRDY